MFPQSPALLGSQKEMEYPARASTEYLVTGSNLRALGSSPPWKTLDISPFASISSSIKWGKYFLFPMEIAMADVYPVPCDQVPRTLPTPGTDVDIRNKKKTKTPVITFGLPGCREPFLGSLFVHKQVQWERPGWRSRLLRLWEAAETFPYGSWQLLPESFLWF